MQLHIDHENSQNATVLVRWCLSAAEIRKARKIASKSIPAVLISVVSVKNDGSRSGDYREESRKIVDLDKMATYVTMTSPGRHHICAILFWDNDDTYNFSKVSHRTRFGLVYERTVFDFHDVRNGFNLRDAFYLERIRDNPYASIDVSVDERSFAKRPCDYQFVNSWFEYPPLDECAFRKRRYFMVYPFMLLWLPLRLPLSLMALAFFLIVLGCRNINWRALNPFSGVKLCDMISGIGPKDSAYISDKNGKAQPWRLMLCPLVWLIWCSAYNAVRNAGFLHYSLVCLTILISIVLSVAIIVLGKRWFDIARESLNRRMAQVEKQQIKARRKELNKLSCDLVPKEVSLQSLPIERKTVYLRFIDLKRRVCRPFAR